MTDREQAAVEFLKKQLQDLEIIQPHALKTTNAIRAKEQFHKWKLYVIGAVAEKLGPTYGERLQIEWIETAYAGETCMMKSLMTSRCAFADSKILSGKSGRKGLNQKIQMRFHHHNVNMLDR